MNLSRECLEALRSGRRIGPLVLRSGRSVCVALCSGVQPAAMHDFLKSLSPESTYLRFLHATDPDSPQEYSQLMREELPYRFSLAALEARLDSCDFVVGVSSWRAWEGLPSDYGAASQDVELAFVVRDDWQHQGIATVFLEVHSHLAQVFGAPALSLYTIPENRSMREVIDSSADILEQKYDNDLLHLRFKSRLKRYYYLASEEREIKSDSR